MRIEERKVTIREVTEGYFNDAEEGVVGYDEQLDIRPKYQREFVYKDKQRDEVIRTVMKGLPWGLYYNEHHERRDLDPKELEERVSELMADEDVSRKAGVYEYLLTGKEKALSIRAFDKRDARAAYERQKGICPICGEHFEYEEMHADHIVPWSKGGKTVPDNCQMLCRDCNLKKGAQ